MSGKSILSKEQVIYVAKLAKLRLKNKEIIKFQTQLSQILDFVKELTKVDTKKVKPTSQVTGLKNVFREDEVASSLSQEEALANAPDRHEGFFKVRAVFNE